MDKQKESLVLDNAAVESALAEYFARVDRGESVDVTEIIAAYPGCEEELRQFLNEENQLHEALAATALSASDQEVHAGKTLGDFRLLSELGRGGMGVVYEAEQLSLGRHVALKILPYAAMLDKQQLARFKNEARAAATLDHPNIVAVHSVGCEGEVHFYTMHLVHGQSFAQIISHLRRLKNPAPTPADPTLADPLRSTDDGEITTDGIRNGVLERESEINIAPISLNPTSVAPFAGLPEYGSADYFRTVARLGIDAASALDHAHANGILHRDVKPGNLMLDESGKLWVTDFGLARIEADAGMTMTGDLVGTLRYMSPEQAQGSRAVVDQRSDIYSLGVTLYELLTLQPAFGESDRTEILKRIANDEPRPLRQIESRIPIDMETIVLKAMRKAPEERYATAASLANDLQNYLENKPIDAKPPTRRERVAKWSRRHVGVVWTALAAALFGSALLAASAVIIAESWQVANTERYRAEADRKDAIAQRDEARRIQYYAEIVSGQTSLDRSNYGRLRQNLIRQLPLGDESDRRGWEWYYLFSQCHPEQRALYYPSYKENAAWSPDGEYIATSGTIWKADSGECIRRLCVDGNKGVAWSPDGVLLAWGTVWGHSPGDSCIYIWNRKTDKVNVWRGHDSSVWCVAFSPDGKQLASGSIDGTVKTWDMATGTVIQTLQAGGNVTDVGYSPDGKLLAAGVGGENVLHIWSVATGERIALRKGAKSDWVSISWHPNGQKLAVNTSGHWYILSRPEWNLVFDASHSTVGYDSKQSDIEWNLLGTQLAVAHGTFVTIWDTDRELQIAKLAGHTDPVKSVSWSPDGSRLVTTDEKPAIRIWDLASPFQPPSINTGAPLERLTWGLDSNTIVSVAASNMTSSFWRVSDGSRIKAVPTNTTNHDAEWGRVLSPDQRLTAQWIRLEERQAIIIRDAQSDTIHSTWRSDELFEPLSFAWSWDGSKLAIKCASDNELRFVVWDVVHKQQISCWQRRKIFFAGGNRIDSPTWSPDGARLALIGKGDFGDSGSKWDPHVRVVDVASGRRIAKRASPDGGSIESLSFSSDGRFLAFGTSEGLITVVNLDAETRDMSFKADGRAICAIDWSRDSQRLAVAAVDGVIKVIEPWHGNELLALRTTGARLVKVSWSPDGQRLAAAAEDGAINVWDARRGYEFAEGGSRSSELGWAYCQLADESVGGATELALRKALQLVPQSLDNHTMRGNLWARLEQYADAVEEFRAARSAQALPDISNDIDLALALLGAGDIESYRKMQLTDFDTVRLTNNEFGPLIFAYLCALIPDNVEGFANLAEKLKKQSAERKQLFAIDWEGAEWERYSMRVLGAMLFRLGLYDDAVPKLTDISEQLNQSQDPTSRYLLACTRYFLAMTHHRLGHGTQSRRCFDEACAIDNKRQKDPSLMWTSRVVLNTLHREAKSLIGQ